MDWLSSLLTTHVALPELFTSGAVLKALGSLKVPIDLKYAWTQTGKGTPLWKQATSTAMHIVKATLSVRAQFENLSGLNDEIWSEIAGIAHAIMRADLKPLVVSTSFPLIEEDEDFDCENMRQIRDMIMPYLGRASTPASVRRTYARSLFEASIIHASKRERFHLDASTSPLADLTYVPFGSVRDPDPNPREDMAYLCFRELIALVSISANVSVDKASNEAGHSTNDETATEETANSLTLAQVAAPYLMLRLAMPIKAYLADQPLRGSLPMPLSMVEELLFVLETLRTLRCSSNVLEGEAECDGFEVLSGSAQAGGAATERVHIRLLHPLLVKAVGVAGHRRHGDREILEACMRVLEVVD